MSLKVEQILDSFFFAETEPRIYTTGAYLVLMKILKGSEERYVWVVHEFDDDSFSYDGKICSPRLYSDKLENLVGV